MATDFTSQITAWYQAVQYRTPPAAELAFFSQALNSGSLTPDLVQAQILTSTFTTTIVNPVIREYQAALGRQPDAAGAAYWVGQVAANPTAGLASLATTFANSPEFFSHYGLTATGIPNSGHVTALYINVYGRQPDAAGLTFWTNAGLTAAQLLNAFANAVEFVNSQAAPIVTFQQAAILAATTPIVSPTVPAGSTFTLTTGNDTVVGTAGDDTINGILSGASTLNAADTITGGAGKDTLNVTVTTAVALPAFTMSGVETLNINATSNLNSSSLAAFTDLMAFNADRATATITATNAGSGLAYGILGDGSALSPGSFNFGYAAGATVETLNLAGGVKSNAGTNVFLTGSGITSTVINSSGAANSLSTAATAGVIVTASSSTSITINASSDLTAALSSTNDSTLTVTGSGTVDLRGISYGFSLNKNITTIDASAQTAGGTLIQAGNPANASTLKFIGGPGNDAFGLGTVFAAGASIDGGAGTDTLRTNNATFITAATGALIKNFEIVDIAANIVVDLANLAANNTLTGLRLGGASNVVNNVTAAVANNVTIYASGSPNLNLIGATNGGQIDTVSIDANDGLAAVNTINLGAPGLTGVEILNLKATDNILISGLNNSVALTNINISGAGNTSITTGAIAVNSGATVDASTATGNFTINATGATTNGYTVKGSSGVNVITGGSAPITVDLVKSVANADQVVITSATGSTVNVVTSVSSFTNAAGTGDKLDVINTATITADVGAGTATGVVNLTAQITSGIITFGGAAAATATFAQKVDAAASLAGTTQYNEVAFEHAGSTYVFEQGDTTATYAAGTDLIIKLVGVTGVTALSTTASGANQVWTV